MIATGLKPIAYTLRTEDGSRFTHRNAISAGGWKWRWHN